MERGCDQDLGVLEVLLEEAVRALLVVRDLIDEETHQRRLTPRQVMYTHNKLVSLRFEPATEAELKR